MDNRPIRFRVANTTYEDLLKAEPREGKRYAGRILDGHRVVTVDGVQLHATRSLSLCVHTADGFAWGDRGPRTLQLALAVLLDAGLSPAAALHWHGYFAEAIFARLDAEKGWDCHEYVVHGWTGDAREAWIQLGLDVPE